jgi:glutaredoxin
MAQEFLAQKGVEFTTFDVTKDKAALEEMRQISGGALRVPVISVCSDVMVGFDRERVELALRCLGQSSEI